MSPTITKSKFGSIASAACFALALGTTASFGQTYSFTVANPTPQDSSAGVISEISSTYNKTNQTLSFSTNLFQNSGQIANGFWVVLNTGPNPKGVQDELAIFYVDASNSFDGSGNATGNGPIVSVYGYNGQNSSNSFSDPGVLLKSTQSGLQAGESTIATGDATSRTMGFTLSVAGVNDSDIAETLYASQGKTFDPANWYGTGFGDGETEELAGLWFHTLAGSNFTYDGENEITGLAYKKQGWVDTNSIPVDVVPEPSSAALIGAAGALLLFRRRRA